jgi:Tol biopolymer transport system component
MALAPGKRFGPYEIIAALGAGGMGEVYRAKDTRLDREVAIKILPAELSGDPDLRARFEREARAISSLNHPNICALYDVGEADGVDFLVMELLEGESLAERLHKGALPIPQLLAVGQQIADALERAHRSGIVHRDLKPGNIVLTKAGAKLLDFGLAKPGGKSLSAATGFSGAITKTTPVSPITQRGTVVGTFQYMAPEQIEGGEADARSDIFSFGAVLYEMATGKRAFEGKSTLSVASAILEKEPPPISTIQPLTPPALEQVVQGCLAKSPDDRIQTAHDVKLQLKWIAEGRTSQAGVPALLATRRKWRGRIAWAAALVVAALGIWIAWSLGARSHERGAVRMTIPLPPGLTLDGASHMPLAFSADGSTIVFSAEDAGRKRTLFTRRVNDFSVNPIPGTEDGTDPALSPDGAWLAFIASGKLKKVQLKGGSPIELAEAQPVGTAWGPDDTIYYLTNFGEGIKAISAAGGTARDVTHTGAAKDDRAHEWPQVLPGGKFLLFTAWTGGSFDDARVEAVELSTGKRTVLVRGGTFGRYIPTGHLLYERAGDVVAVAFDPASLAIHGEPVTVLQGVRSGTGNGEARLAFSATGDLVYEPGGVTTFARELVWVDRKGNATKATDSLRPYGDGSFSPDGKRLAVTIEASTYDVWIYDFTRDTLTKFTFGADDSAPLWSPDGKSIVYRSTKEGTPQLYVKHLAGGEEVVTSGDPDKYASSWFPDSKGIIFQARHGDDGWDVYSLELGGDHKPALVAGGPHDQAGGKVSPNGHWLAFRSNESGRDEIYVQSLAGGSIRYQASREGGSRELWSHDGKEIFYFSGNKAFAVKVTENQGELVLGRPELLFESKSPMRDESVAPGDKGFFIIRDVADPNAPGTQINVILNWFDELKQAAAKK